MQLPGLYKMQGETPAFWGPKPGLLLFCIPGGKHFLTTRTSTCWYLPVACRKMVQKALSKMFRGIVVRLLRQLIDENKLKLPDGFEGFSVLKQKLYAINWNVYSKKALGGINSVLAYLGRYSHRVAISNNRLVRIESNKVTFRFIK